MVQIKRMKCFLFFFQFLCEMAMAWQMTVDKKLGIFAEDKPRPDPLAKTEDQSLDPNPPMVAGHQIWTKVGLYPPFFIFNSSRSDQRFVVS